MKFIQAFRLRSFTFENVTYKNKNVNIKAIDI